MCDVVHAGLQVTNLLLKGDYARLARLSAWCSSLYVLQDVQTQERSDGPGDELLHDFVCATVDALHTTVDECTSDRVLGHVAPPAKELCVRGTLQSGTTEIQR